ncbi:bestrophin family protein [Kamptonema formosum]|uniref:bestrophin family protein n=1 Tax=Kamptonema formosum TaxID=331992 RepID=UPI00035D85CB|nr:bestrophin family ion channel [Oscillatoria sp. PCC 10802]
MEWFRLAFQLRGSVAVTVFPRALLCGGFGFIVSLLYYFEVPLEWRALGSVISNVVFNLILGLLLVFRTNTAYDRFWEGRKNWGTIVVSVRNLARQIWVGVAEVEPADREKKASVLRVLAAFAVATKLRLRQEPVSGELEELVDASLSLQLNSVKSPPLEVIRWVGAYLQQQHDRNCLNSNQLMAMNKLLDSLVEALTGCERILTTPIPPAYGIYLKRVLLIYCIALPFKFVENLKFGTCLMVILISFVLFGVEEIGNEIENPFGYDPNDLPLDDLCKTIQGNIEDLSAPLVALESSNTSDLLPT